MSFKKFNHLGKKSSETPDTPTTIAKPVVLVIDDDLRILQGLELNLQEKYTVRLCENSTEIMKRIDQKVRVVILDIKMPGKSGFEVYKEIKAQFPDVPIIFYSAYQNVLEGARMSREYQPFNYFDKGGNVQELLESVERAVKYYDNMLNMEKLVGQLRGFREQE